jgi:hypothetical protein
MAPDEFPNRNGQHRLDETLTDVSPQESVTRRELQKEEEETGCMTGGDEGSRGHESRGHEIPSVHDETRSRMLCEEGEGTGTEAEPQSQGLEEEPQVADQEAVEAVVPFVAPVHAALPFVATTAFYQPCLGQRGSTPGPSRWGGQPAQVAFSTGQPSATFGSPHTNHVASGPSFASSDAQGSLSTTPGCCGLPPLLGVGFPSQLRVAAPSEGPPGCCGLQPLLGVGFPSELRAAAPSEGPTAAATAAVAGKNWVAESGGQQVG